MKKILIFLLTLFVLIPVYAKPTTFNREIESNLGVHKKWNINETNRQNVLNTPYVNSQEKIYDFTDTMNISEESQNNLKTLIANFYNKYKTEVIIYIDDFTYYSDSYNDTKATDFYDYNDFALSEENYSGILLLRNINTIGNDPYYGLYMFGKAQLYIDQNRWNNILDNIYDSIHVNNYEEAIKQLLNELEYYYSKGIPNSRKDYILDNNNALKYQYVFRPNYKAYSIVGAIVALIGFLIAKSKHKVVRLKNEANDYVDLNDSKFTTTKDLYVTSSVTRVRIVQQSSSSGGGFSSHGSSGGGFSGGGRHG